MCSLWKRLSAANPFFSVFLSAPPADGAWPGCIARKNDLKVTSAYRYRAATADRGGRMSRYGRYTEDGNLRAFLGMWIAGNFQGIVEHGLVNLARVLHGLIFGGGCVSFQKMSAPGRREVAQAVQIRIRKWEKIEIPDFHDPGPPWPRDSFRSNSVVL